jgi:hypothetical protein
MPSQVIRRFSYDAGQRQLKVAFTSGSVYLYDDVPAETHDGLRQAFSKGRYFGAHIRGRFPCRRIAHADRRRGRPDLLTA